VLCEGEFAAFAARVLLLLEFGILRHGAAYGIMRR
jgi:hypothetical protein